MNEIPSDEVISETIEALKKRNFNVILVNSKEEALEAIKNFIPAGSEIMNGSSTTLHEIGFNDYLKDGTHGWNNLHVAILNEKDPVKKKELMRRADSSEYFLGSVNAISQNGELVACDASGSRVGAYLFSAKKLVLVSGVNKISADLQTAMQRVRDFVFPLEDARALKAYGMHSSTNKWMILEGDSSGRVTVVLVKEKLGF